MFIAKSALFKEDSQKGKLVGVADMDGNLMGRKCFTNRGTYKHPHFSVGSIMC